MPTPYDTARQPGGRHHGWYLQQRRLSIDELQGAIASFQKQILKHTQWIADPASKTSDFPSFDPRRQQALVLGWQQDIQRHRECIEILLGVIEEKKP